MASNQNLARLGFVLALDSGELKTELDDLNKRFKNFSNEAKRDTVQAAKAIVELEEATQRYGKTLTKVEEIQLQFKTGKFAQADEMTKKALLEKAKAYDAIATSATKSMTAQQKAALGYQTTDIITSLAGGQNPMMVLLQQGGQLRDQFGGFRPLFAGIASSITPVMAGFTALAASIGVVTLAFMKGEEESEKFRNSMSLTGNFAGIGITKFNTLAESLSNKYNSAIGASRDVMQQLVASGQFTEKSLFAVGSAITKVASLSKESADKVAETLMQSFDGSAESAKRLNSRFHFLSVEQYKYIETLNKQGKVQEAIAFTANALTEKLDAQATKLGSLERMWKGLTSAASGFWDWLKSIGREDPLKELRLLEKQIENTMKGVAYRNGKTSEYDALIAKRDRLKAQIEADEKAASSTSAQAEKDAAAIALQQKYGQQISDLATKIAEDKAKTEYAIAAKGLDEISQLNLKKKMEDALAAQELAKKISSNPQIAGQLRAAASAELERKKAELALQQGNVSRDELLNYSKKADAEQNSIELERQRLDVYKQNIMASDADLQIALSRLKTEQQIAEIEANKKLEADPKGRATEIARLEQIQKAREAVINQAADLKMLQDMNQSVFNNMGNAIDNFVRNGKLSFKDLTRSIIQDLISIAMRAQMMAMFKGFSFFGGGSSATVTTGAPVSPSIIAPPTLAANGAYADAGQPFYVGEQGPELFVPQGAGTIMPNKMIGAMTNNQPQVVYNGPYLWSCQIRQSQQPQGLPTHQSSCGELECQQ